MFYHLNESYFYKEGSGFVGGLMIIWGCRGVDGELMGETVLRKSDMFRVNAVGRIVVGMIVAP